MFTIYLDNAATTRIDPVVLQEMEPFLNDEYGNPNSIYKFGKTAREAIDKARMQVSQLLNCKPDNIVFTSGGSEGNSLVIRGTHRYLRYVKRPLVLTTEAEHESVLSAVRSLYGYTPIPIHDKMVFDDYGEFNFRVLEKEFRNNPLIGMVSIMYVNNEFGSVNPIKDIATICHANNILYHTDCVQAAGGFPIDVNDIGCDFLTISSHKIHGPKGCGALYVRDFSVLEPIIYGSLYQENGYRGGTENVSAIVGFGKACEIANENLKSADQKTSTLKQVFYSRLETKLAESNLEEIMHVNGEPVLHNGKILSLRFDGVDGESLVYMADVMGLCVSTGSACHGGGKDPSKALLAIGLTEEEAHSTIRISFSRFNTEEEVIQGADIIAKCVEVLHGGKI